MELATFPSRPAAAPDRCGERTRRLGQVKFVALVIEPEPAEETLSSTPDSLYRRLRTFLLRVAGRLVAARP